jgi:hypothetical protein
VVFVRSCGSVCNKPPLHSTLVRTNTGLALGIPERPSLHTRKHIKTHLNGIDPELEGVDPELEDVDLIELEVFLPLLWHFEDTGSNPFFRVSGPTLVVEQRHLLQSLFQRGTIGVCHKEKR